MAGQNQTINVELTPSVNSGQFVWEMAVIPPAPAPRPVPSGPPYPLLVVDEKNTATFKFTINAPGQNIVFAEYPILIPADDQAGDKKPTIKDVSVDPTGTQLTFSDRNGKKIEFPYILFFRGAPCLDPVIKNGGGGPGIQSTSEVYLKVVGVLVIAALVVAAFAFKK